MIYTISNGRGLGPTSTFYFCYTFVLFYLHFYRAALNASADQLRENVCLSVCETRDL